MARSEQFDEDSRSESIGPLAQFNYRLRNRTNAGAKNRCSRL